MANTNCPAGYDIDILGHVQLDDRTWAVEWCYRGDTDAEQHPSQSTELRVTVTDRLHHDGQVEVEVRSCDVPRDVWVQLWDYVVAEEQRSYEMARAS